MPERKEYRAVLHWEDGEVETTPGHDSEDVILRAERALKARRARYARRYRDKDAAPPLGCKVEVQERLVVESPWEPVSSWDDTDS